MKVKEESEKVSLKLNIQKTKIMASGPITSWQIDEETMETVTHFIFLGSQITADGDCCHEIKRCLLLGRKTMTNLDSILKSRVKAMVFPIVMCGCENWTIKSWMWLCPVHETDIKLVFCICWILLLLFIPLLHILFEMWEGKCTYILSTQI